MKALGLEIYLDVGGPGFLDMPEAMSDQTVVNISKQERQGFQELMASYNNINLNSKQMKPRSPGTHMVGPWVIDSINLYRDLRTGTQYIGNWACRVTKINRSSLVLQNMFEDQSIPMNTPYHAFCLQGVQGLGLGPIVYSGASHQPDVALTIWLQIASSKVSLKTFGQNKLILLEEPSSQPKSLNPQLKKILGLRTDLRTHNSKKLNPEIKNPKP